MYFSLVRNSFPVRIEPCSIKVTNYGPSSMLFIPFGLKPVYDRSENLFVRWNRRGCFKLLSSEIFIPQLVSVLIKTFFILICLLPTYRFLLYPNCHKCCSWIIFIHIFSFDFSIAKIILKHFFDGSSMIVPMDNL